MRCDEARGAFSDLYDGVLSGGPLAALHRHVEECPACRAEWAAFRNAVRVVTELGGAEPSAGFAARVRQRIEAPPWWRWVLRWLFVPLRVKVPIQALALLLATFAGLLLFQRSPELRREVELSKKSPAPVARQPAPATPTPPEAERTARTTEEALPRPGVSKTERVEHQAPPVEPVSPPQARLDRKKDLPASALRDEAKGLGKAEAPAPGKEGRPSSIPAGSADDLYAAALTALAGQQYDRAIDALRAFLREHPRDARVPDALFQLADAYFAEHRYAEAILEYEALIRQFPDSRLVPAALFKQGQARLALGDRAGCQALREVTDRFPGAPEAALAKDTLSARCP